MGLESGFRSISHLSGSGLRAGFNIMDSCRGQVSYIFGIYIYLAFPLSPESRLRKDFLYGILKNQIYAGFSIYTYQIEKCK
jgi:hypothetical protein